MGSRGLHLVQRHFEDRRAVACQRPAAEPAAIAALIDADHLIEVLLTGVRGGKSDVVTLMKVHDWSVRTDADGLMKRD